MRRKRPENLDPLPVIMTIASRYRDAYRELQTATITIDATDSPPNPEEPMPTDHKRPRSVYAVREHMPGVEQIISVRDFAILTGLSYPTAVRMIKDGEGPPAIRLAKRRIGIRLSDYNKWLGGRDVVHGSHT